MGIGLHDIVEVLMSGIGDILSLPEAEGIDEPNLEVLVLCMSSPLEPPTGYQHWP